MASRIGFNIQAQGVLDRDKLSKRIQQIQPRAVVVINDPDLCKVIRSLSPDTVVIHRQYPDDGRCNPHSSEYVSPDAFVTQKTAELRSTGVWAYTANEPGFNDQTLQWHIDVMKRAAQTGLKLVVGNFSSGTPGPDDWPKARAMLELLDQNRATMILGLHEYACGEVTSGFYGGYPNHAGVPFGQSGGIDLTRYENWPQDLSRVTKWHCGRFNFLVGYCNSISLKPPRIILTEHGFDDMSDIKAWSDTLVKTDPYINIRGWKSLQNQWGEWFGQRGWTSERAYFEQLKYADRGIYQNSPVEAQCLFIYGHASPQWGQFDIENADELFTYLEVYTAPPIVPPQPSEPPPTPKPDYSAITQELTQAREHLNRAVELFTQISQ